jgi:hypothetical protein
MHTDIHHHHHNHHSDHWQNSAFLAKALLSGFYNIALFLFYKARSLVLHLALNPDDQVPESMSLQ